MNPSPTNVCKNEQRTIRMISTKGKLRKTNLLFWTLRILKDKIRNKEAHLNRTNMAHKTKVAPRSYNDYRPKQ